MQLVSGLVFCKRELEVRILGLQFQVCSSWLYNLGQGIYTRQLSVFSYRSEDVKPIRFLRSFPILWLSSCSRLAKKSCLNVQPKVKKHPGNANHGPGWVNEPWNLYPLWSPAFRRDFCSWHMCSCIGPSVVGQDWPLLPMHCGRKDAVWLSRPHYQGQYCFCLGLLDRLSEGSWMPCWEDPKAAIWASHVERQWGLHPPDNTNLDDIHLARVKPSGDGSPGWYIDWRLHERPWARTVYPDIPEFLTHRKHER